MHHSRALAFMAAIGMATLVGEAFRVKALAADYVVDPSGAAGAFKTVQAAINAVPAGTAEERTRIVIRPGTYTEQLRVPESKRYLTLSGQGAKPDDVVLTFNLHAKSNKPGGGVVGTTDSSSTFINAKDFAAHNLTFANSTPPKVAQAVAIKPQADRLVFSKCRFVGFQDTLYPCKGRQYYKDCYITGTVDFIFGDGTAVFDHCTINNSDRGYITAASTAQNTARGFVFLDCLLTASDAIANQPNTVYLGRPWRPFGCAAYIRCKMGPHIRSVGWDNWNNAANEKTARYAEFGSMDLKGQPLDVSKRVAWSRQLTAAEAQDYTVEKLLGGTDQWDPADAISPRNNQGGDNLDGYLTKDGKLAQPLEIRDLQGGFAGFTGTYYKVESDGKWSTGSVFQAKLKEDRGGTLAKDDIAKLAKALAKFDLLKLKSEGKPGTNPHVVTIKFGKSEASLTLGAGVMLPKADPMAKALTVEQRYSAIVDAVRELSAKK